MNKCLLNTLSLLFEYFSRQLRNKLPYSRATNIVCNEVCLLAKPVIQLCASGVLTNLETLET